LIGWIEYFRALHRLIDQIFSEAADHFEWTWAKLASHANLSYPTVVNLGERQTKYPRFQTVYKLAHAVGWKLVLETVKRQKKASTAKMAVG
jgi:AraC-like DNA-binding protein